MLNTVTVIGLGMMGASLALALKKRIPGVRIKAIVRRERYVERALRQKIVDEIFVGPHPDALKSDFVVIAVPVLSIIGVMEEISPSIGKNTIVTDIGSVKKIIMDHANRIFGPSTQFIGSHPMCGSEKSGMEHGHADLYQGATCILTSTEKTKADSVQKLADFWKTAGCLVIEMNAAEHDRQVAIVSHLPHLLSTVLMNHIYDTGEEKKGILGIAGPGFSDMTRLSAGNPSVWMDIFESNRDYLIEAVKNYRKSLDAVLSVLNKNDKERLFQYLKSGTERKQDLEKGETPVPRDDQKR
ncbi:MAG: prephenate dehydrogenase [Candidatus Aureabacteria bacterium]|nr:prephenate dehydrogenase [Candidatus Auribacterota bacterium]